MELATAARRYLLTIDEIRAYVVTNFPDGRPQQVRGYSQRLGDEIDGTGRLAFVVEQNNGWTTPVPGRSMEYPILRVRAYADHDREVGSGLILRPNALDKAHALSRAIDRVLHRPGGARDEQWGGDSGLWVIDCARRDEPIAVTGVDEHGTSTLGDTAYVQRQYNLVTVH